MTGATSHDGLTASVKRVAALYGQLEHPERVNVTGIGWRIREHELDVALASDDSERVSTAIRSWESHAVKVIGCGS